MSDPIKLKLTKVGLEKALNADLNGIKVKLAKIKYSTSKFASVANDTRTTLSGVVHESTIVAGGTSIGSNTLRFVSVIDSVTAYDIGSIGIFTDDNVLFAVASVTTGELMKILPRISFVMSFGMTLTALVLENVQVVIDHETALAVALVLQHEKHTDPHPQYTAKIKTLTDAVNKQIADLADDLDDFSKSVGSTYPKILLSGVSSGENGTVQVGSKISNLTLSKYTVMITPEGGHEGWTISRGATSFSYNVYNRSGTNRIGYGGNVNWMVIQNSA